MRCLATLALACFVTSAYADHALDNRNLDNGQLLYAAQCASCHGVNLEGQLNWRRAGENGILPAPPHDASGHTWHHDNQLLFDYTKFGGQQALAARGIGEFKSGMPAFADAISDEDIWDILAFIHSTWPAHVQEAQANRNPRHD